MQDHYSGMKITYIRNTQQMQIQIWSMEFSIKCKVHKFSSKDKKYRIILFYKLFLTLLFVSTKERD